MHLLSASCVLLLLLGGAVAMETVSGVYGETLEIPCNGGAVNKEEVFITKWKYDKGDGLFGDLLVRNKDENVSVLATDEYRGRVNMAANASLLLAAAALSDQRTFTCMVVSISNIAEFPVTVNVYKSPAELQISERAAELEIGKLTKLGTCVAKDANPAAEITWMKNNVALVADGKGVLVDSAVTVDSVSGLSSSSSVLSYSALKEDADAVFTCSVQAAAMTSPPATFTIIYSTENVVLQVSAVEPILEGDNVTLKCLADGNPPPSTFNFHLKDEVVTVKNSDTFTISNVSRDSSGEYKCSLVDDPTVTAFTHLTVSYLDVSLKPSGKITKNAGEELELTLQTDASGDVTVAWTKDGVKLDKQPAWAEVTYGDAGRYEVEVTMGLLSRKASLELEVEGAPVIRRLSKQREDGRHEVLICEVEGSPKPAVFWSINGTSVDESPFVKGKLTHRLVVVPTANLSVSCSVSNAFGVDSKVINVSSVIEEVRMDKRDQSDGGDRTKVVVGVVVGLLMAVVVVGVAYWLYRKNSKQGSWKTGEKELGSSEEEKKLEEKVEENSQKAEV